MSAAARWKSRLGVAFVGVAVCASAGYALMGYQSGWWLHWGIAVLWIVAAGMEVGNLVLGALIADRAEVARAEADEVRSRSDQAKGEAEYARKVQTALNKVKLLRSTKKPQNAPEPPPWKGEPPMPDN